MEEDQFWPHKLSTTHHSKGAHQDRWENAILFSQRGLLVDFAFYEGYLVPLNSHFDAWEVPCFPLTTLSPAKSASYPDFFLCVCSYCY